MNKTYKRTGILLLALAAFTSGSIALHAQQKNALADRMAALQQSVKENQQRLHQYQWTETQQLTLKGEPKPPKQFLCQYGLDGQVQKTPIASEGMQPSQGGRLKQRMVKKKTEDIQDYMEQVKTLLGLYVPPDPVKLKQAYDAGNASISKGSAPGTAVLTFHNYDKTGDQMIITFNPKTKKIAQLSVNTYMQQPSEAITLDTHFASLPDGTNYAQKTVLNMSAKKLIVTTTNSHYQKLQ